MARIVIAMNGKRINTLDDLRSNFNGKQMLNFYRAGRLQKWLEELGENDLLETVQSFRNENYDDETLLSMLMASFKLNDQQIAEARRSVEQEKAEQTEEKPECETQPSSEVPETCWYCEGEGKVHMLTDICPICHGEKVSAPPQWLKMIRDDKVSNDDKLRGLAQEVLKVVNDVIANCDDLPADLRNREIGLFVKYRDLEFKMLYHAIFFNELYQAIKLNFGDRITIFINESDNPFSALLIIAEKYLPDFTKNRWGESLQFKARYAEMLYSEFGK